MTVSSTPPGIPSRSRLEGWMNDTIGGEPAELTGIQLIVGGRSNLTYRLTVSGPAGSRSLVLRRPPLGHVLPTAHDMSREYRVLTALSGTPGPPARAARAGPPHPEPREGARGPAAHAARAPRRRLRQGRPGGPGPGRGVP